MEASLAPWILHREAGTSEGTVKEERKPQRAVRLFEEKSENQSLQEIQQLKNMYSPVHCKVQISWPNLPHSVGNFKMTGSLDAVNYQRYYKETLIFKEDLSPLGILGRFLFSQD